ncbi:hypothetical protein DFJ73DRAFT_939921 [Zopfochytrium polystomum]|nr:hypothetical protein DFJ73DRAFT_939921 [Zopfochytrium polystomum]
MSSCVSLPVAKKLANKTGKSSIVTVGDNNKISFKEEAFIDVDEPECLESLRFDVSGERKIPNEDGSEGTNATGEICTIYPDGSQSIFVPIRDCIVSSNSKIGKETNRTSSNGKYKSVYGVMVVNVGIKVEIMRTIMGYLTKTYKRFNYDESMESIGSGYFWIDCSTGLKAAKFADENKFFANNAGQVFIAMVDGKDETRVVNKGIAKNDTDKRMQRLGGSIKRFQHVSMTDISRPPLPTNSTTESYDTKYVMKNQVLKDLKTFIMNKNAKREDEGSDEEDAEEDEDEPKDEGDESEPEEESEDREGDDVHPDKGDEDEGPKGDVETISSETTAKPSESQATGSDEIKKKVPNRRRLPSKDSETK